MNMNGIMWYMSWAKNSQRVQFHAMLDHYGIFDQLRPKQNGHHFVDFISWVKFQRSLFIWVYLMNSHIISSGNVLASNRCQGNTWTNNDLYASPGLIELTFLPLDKMVAISQTIFSDAFPWIRCFELMYHLMLLLYIHFNLCSWATSVIKYLHPWQPSGQSTSTWVSHNTLIE